MIVVPDLKTVINSSEYLRSQAVDASDFSVKIEQQNRIYARSCGQSAGLVFEAGSHWSTADASFVTAPIASGTVDFKTWQGLMFFERDGLAGAIDLRFEAYGEGIEVRTICTRHNIGGTTTTFTADFSSIASPGWFGGVISFTNATRRSLADIAKPPAPFTIAIQARATASPTVGRLNSFIFFEDVLDAGTSP